MEYASGMLISRQHRDGLQKSFIAIDYVDNFANIIVNILIILGLTTLVLMSLFPINSLSLCISIEWIILAYVSIKSYLYKYSISTLLISSIYIK
jgi:hypothetical protein